MKGGFQKSISVRDPYVFIYTYICIYIYIHTYVWRLSVGHLKWAFEVRNLF